MSDFGDIAISKNCQSHPNWHETIFEDSIFWKIIFKNQFFPKISKKDALKFQKKIFKKIFKTFFVNNPRPTAVPISHSCVHTNSNVVYTLSTDAFYRCPVLVFLSFSNSWRWDFSWSKPDVLRIQNITNLSV